MANENKWMPRRFREHKEHAKLQQIADANLRAGDILIVKAWSNVDAAATVIRAGQAIFSHVRRGSSQSKHVLINCVDGAVHTIESQADGLNIKNRIEARDHVVYSCGDNALRLEACYVAKRLAGEHTVEPIDSSPGLNDPIKVTTAKQFAAWRKMDSKIHYRSAPGFAKSVFRRKNKGIFANARLEKLYGIVYDGLSDAGVKMICSEFVASCYEVAALRIEKITGQNPLPFGRGVDPRAMTPKAFESVLGRSNTQFGLAGLRSYRGSTTDLRERVRIRGVAELYRQTKRTISIDKLDTNYNYLTDPRTGNRAAYLTANGVNSYQDWCDTIAKAYDEGILAP